MCDAVEVRISDPEESPGIAVVVRKFDDELRIPPGEYQLTIEVDGQRYQSHADSPLGPWMEDDAFRGKYGTFRIHRMMPEYPVLLRQEVIRWHKRMARDIREREQALEKDPDDGTASPDERGGWSWDRKLGVAGNLSSLASLARQAWPFRLGRERATADLRLSGGWQFPSGRRPDTNRTAICRRCRNPPAAGLDAGRPCLFGWGSRGRGIPPPIRG